MRKVSGDLHIVDFKTKQIIASIQPEDYLDDLRHWEIKDNVDILDFKLLEDSPFLDYIQQKNLILKETNPGVITPYVITSIEKDSEAHNVTIYASGEWILLDKENYIKPQEIKSWSAEQYLALGITGTGWEIGLIEAEGKRSFKIEKFISPLQFIQQIATLFDNIEIQYRIEIGTGKPRRFIDLVKKRGRETNKEVTLGKDLVGIKRIENSENIITALVPYYIGQDADGNDKLITIESVNNGSQYIVDDAAFQRWNVNGKHLFGFYTPESEKDELTPARLLTLAKTELKKRVSAIVTYEVNSIDISSVFGYEHEDVSEGDTIRIIDEGMTPTLYLEARAIAGDESHKDKHQNKHTFGNFVEIVDQDEALRKLYQKMLSMINDKVSKEWFAALEEKANDATKKANEAVEESQSAKDLANATKDYMEQNMVDIIEQPTAPTENLRDGKTLWIDSSDPENKVQKLRKDGQWQRVTPDTGPLKQSIKDVKEDIETTKTELNKKVQEAQNQATGQFNEVKETLQSVSRTISDVQNEQGNINKKVTQIEQNADGFKTSIESLTKKDNDISNKLNTVEQTVEGTKKTISDVQQTTSELKKTTTEIKEEAGRTKERMEQINSKVENIDIGVNNLVINSSCDNEKPRMFDQPGESQVGGVDDIRYYEKHLAIKCNRHTDAFYQIGGYEKSLHGLEPGKEVTISADINCESVDYHFEMFYATNTEGNNWRAFVGELYKELKIWKRRSFTFKIPNDTTSIMFRIYFGRVVTSNGTWLNFKNVQIERGNIATGYKRAYQDQVTTDEFTKKTTEIEKSVDGVKTTVSTVQKDQGTMQTTLNQVKQTTDSNSQTITTLSQTQGKQGEVIQQNTSDITQLNNQIKSKVTDTQMQEYIGGLGSTNMLLNTAFEKRDIDKNSGAITNRTPSMDKWNIANPSGTTVVAETVRNREGYNSVKIEDLTATVNRYTGVKQSIPASISSGDYVASVWVYTDDKTTINQGGQLYLQFYNGATGTSTTAGVDITNTLVNGQWKLFSVKITAPAVTITTLQMELWVRKKGRIWVSQPQLQQGSTRSAFMENPKDIGNYDALVGEIAKKVATSDFNNKVTQMETTINQQSSRIDLKAEKNDVYNKVDSDGRYGSKAIVESHTSQLSVMSNEINLRVKSGEIASAINQTAQSVLIQANKIMLDGFIEAKHLKAQELVGVTIKTAPNTENRYVKLNRQFLELYDKDTSRIQLQFFNSNYTSAITPGLVLGKSSTKGLVGASAFYHFTFLDSNGNETGASSQSAIGIVGSVDSNNAFNYASQVRFFETGSINIHGDNNIWIKSSKNGWIDIETDSVGSAQPISIKASSSVQITAGTSIVTNSNTFHRFTGNGVFNFVRNGAPSGQNQTSLEDDGNNADLRLAYVRIRSSHVSGYSGRIQLIPTGESTPTAGLEAGNISYTSLTNRSSRTIKANIRDLEIDSLEKIMGLKVQQYNFKSDVEKLYQMREEAVGTDKVYTTADIPLQYGLVLEDTDETFHADLGDGINLYTLVSLNVDSTQKIKQNQDLQGEKISQLEKELEAQKLKEVDQEKRIATLEELIGKLMNETSTTENTTQTEQP
ncbi:phage tail spike protein [Bacillus cereus]|uniref:phage tail spike protein n=1 Tax=Bacillus cereus TaxID=1396 RepID=UPI000BFD15FD|nr:phage tail spike protein [Bacillus cereus]PGZ66507.1 peptidase S74 [Bacillus cereus]